MSDSLMQSLASNTATLLEALTDAAVIVDQNGIVQVGNRAWWTMLDLPEPPIDSQSYTTYMEPWIAVLPDGTPSGEASSRIEQALAGTPIVAATVRLRHPRTGQICVFSQSATPLRNAVGSIQGAMVINRDVTAHAELDQAKDAFLLYAGHELRTPLTALRGFMDLAADRLRVLEQDIGAGKPLDPVALGRLRHMLERADISSARLDRLIEQLLDISRMQAGRLIIRRLPLDLGNLATTVIARFAPTAPRYTLSLRIDGTTISPGEPVTPQHTIDEPGMSGPLVISADRGRMEQVLQNLLSNAVRFSPPDTVIDVGVYRQDDEVILSVRDRGSGVPQEDRQRIFGLFLRSGTTPQNLSGIPGGLGVGLYISRHIVTMHGGRIWIEDPGDAIGSVFNIALPAFVLGDTPADTSSQDNVRSTNQDVA